MYRRYVTNPILAFKTRLKEEAAKVLRELDEKDRRIIQSTWTKVRHRTQLWNEIAAR